MLSKCQKRKSSLILDEGICKENVYTHSWFKMYCLSLHIYANKAPLTMFQMCEEIMQVHRHVHAIFVSG